jgi:hypothetical protein
MAKRFIFGFSESEDMEMNMILKLKSACGVEYASKLQRMFTDVTLSDEVSRRFKHSPSYDASMDCNILVLTAGKLLITDYAHTRKNVGTWPLSQNNQNTPSLPNSMHQTLQHFTQFYNAQHSGRRLSWLHHLSRCDLRINGLDKRYEVTVSLHQALILLRFEDEGSLHSIQDLAESTNLTPEDVERSLKASHLNSVSWHSNGIADVRSANFGTSR